MPTFIESSNCRSGRPKGIVGKEHFPRPELIARLLRDRHVARFLITPTGYGKSNIAYEYAHLIFGFQHVFWIRGDSPCFLRDLDAGSILDEICEIDPKVKLVVFDDVPQLDQTRSESFALLIDSLIEKQCEVIALSVPSADTFSSYQMDASILRSGDLLLSEDELLCTNVVPTGAKRVRTLGASSRIACICWGEDGAISLVKGLKREVLPTEIRASLLLMLLLVNGTIEDVLSHLPKALRTEVIELFDRDYCFLGIDEHSGLFNSVLIEVDLITKYFASDMDQMALACGFSSSDDLIASLSDFLIKEGNCMRACLLMRNLASREKCAEWLIVKALPIVENYLLADLYMLCDFAKPKAKTMRGSIASIQAWCTYLMGVERDNTRFEKKLIALDISNQSINFMRNLLVFLCSKDGSSIAIKHLVSSSLEIKKILNADVITSEKSLIIFAVDSVIAVDGFLTRLAESDQQLESYIHELSSAFARYEYEEHSYRLLFTCLILAKCIDLALDKALDIENCILAISHNHAVRMIQVFIDLIQEEPVSQSAGLMLLKFLVLKDIERISNKYSLKSTSVGGLLANSKLVSIQLRIEEEREMYMKRLRSAESKQIEFKISHPDPYRKNEPSIEQALSVRTSTPILKIKLFGGLNVSIGDQILDPRLLGAKKVRTVLSILAINFGKEVSKEKMASLLWLEDGSVKYRRNFYNIWAKLKKALSVNGVCPYLIRTQSGSRLDERFVVSDIVGFDETCRSMLFGFEDLDNWEKVYSRVIENYSDDLLPGDYDCDFINGMRDQCRAQIVDAMISASKKLLAQGIVDGALWFAREAMMRDNKREDCYIALMEAQIASDQRGYAIRTYFDCRKFLSEELGIDPSLKVIELYRSIIETEEELI